MATFNAQQQQYGFAIEGTHGTAEATADVWYPHTGGNIEDVYSADIVEAAKSRLDTEQEVAEVSAMSEGDFEGLVYDVDHGWLLRPLFNSNPTPATVSGETLVKDHVFSYSDGQSTNDHPSLTVFQKNPIETRAFTYVMIDTYEITFSRDQALRFLMSVKGKKSATDTETVAIAQEEIQLPKGFDFFMEDTQGDLAGGTRIPIQEATLSINKSLVVEMDQGVPRLIHPGNFQVTGSIQLLYENATYRDLVFNNTEKALRFKNTNTGVTIGASSNPFIQFDLYKVKFPNYTRNESFGDLAGQTIEFTALYDETNSEKITCTLRNNKTTQYS